MFVNSSVGVGLSGRRRSDRCASTSPIRSPSSPSIAPRSSVSAAARHSKLERSVAARSELHERAILFPGRQADHRRRDRGAHRRGTAPQRRSGTAITGIAALDRAGRRIWFSSTTPNFAEQARASAAGACLTDRNGWPRAFRPSVALLVVREAVPRLRRRRARAVSRRAAAVVAVCRRGRSAGVAPGAVVHPSARLESGVTHRSRRGHRRRARRSVREP